MTSELLAAIRAAPEDDTPRLVYADWLLERGDRRGDLIIAQCTRYRCEEAGDYTSDRYRSALVTEALALHEVREPWLDALGVEDMANVAFRRGFPIALGGEPEQLFARWERIFELPLETIIFVQQGRAVTMSDLRRWAALPEIPAVVNLSIATRSATAHLEAPRVRDEIAYIDVDEAQAIFADDRVAPYGRFEDYTIALGHGEASDGGSVVAFGDDEDGYWLPPSLHAFSLCCDRIPEWPLVNALRTDCRYLEKLQLGYATAEHALAAFSDWPHRQLHTLSIEAASGVFPLEVARRFAISGAAKLLRHLEGAFPLDDLLANALETRRLETLRLTGGGDAAALEHVLRHQPKLHSLTIGGFQGDVIGALERAAPSQLSVLSLRSMQGLDLARLARWEQQRLAQLTLHDCGATGALVEAPALAAVPWVHAGQTNRMPGAYRYAGETWP